MLQSKIQTKRFIHADKIPPMGAIPQAVLLIKGCSHMFGKNAGCRMTTRYRLIGSQSAVPQTEYLPCPYRAMTPRASTAAMSTAVCVDSKTARTYSRKTSGSASTGNAGRSYSSKEIGVSHSIGAAPLYASGCCQPFGLTIFRKKFCLLFRICSTSLSPPVGRIAPLRIRNAHRPSGCPRSA